MRLSWGCDNKNLNVGFIEKVSNLNANANTLEAVNKEGLRKENKAIQNHRQQTDKATNKDCNGNFVDNVNETLDCFQSNYVLLM